MFRFPEQPKQIKHFKYLSNICTNRQCIEPGSQLYFAKLCSRDKHCITAYLITLEVHNTLIQIPITASTKNYGTNLKKKILPVKNRKNKHHHLNSPCLSRFLYQFSAQTDHFNFLEQICPIRVAQKGHFQSKADKMDTTIESCLYELVFVSNFTLNKQFWVF